MADRRIKDIFGFYREPGEMTITPQDAVPRSDKTEWTVGRSEDCDLIYISPKISRRHCKIEYLGSHYYISDLGSTNGTYVNGRRIERTERLFAGDIIGIGKEDIVFSPELLD